MYIPKLFAESRTTVLHELMRSHPLGALITLGEGGLVANHIPFLLDAAAGPHGRLTGHVARANPVWKATSAAVEALVIFQGPESYITPSWYPSKAEHGKVVPTWNYMVVHARGVPRFIDEPAWLLQHVRQLTDVHEATQATPWRLSDAPADFIEKLAEAIVGVEIEISSLVGKRKMSQNRPEADQQGAIAGLTSQDDDGSRAIAALVQENFR